MAAEKGREEKQSGRKKTDLTAQEYYLRGGKGGKSVFGSYHTPAYDEKYQTEKSIKTVSGHREPLLHKRRGRFYRSGPVWGERCFEACFSEETDAERQVRRTAKQSSAVRRDDYMPRAGQQKAATRTTATLVPSMRRGMTTRRSLIRT